MSSEDPQHRQLHGFFFPLMAYGHMIPMFDIARMFASRGVKATIITTPANASTFSNATEINRLLNLDINVQILQFPAKEVGLTEGCENLDDLDALDTIHTFLKAVNMLQQPLERLLEDYQPDFIVADFTLHWATESAAKFGIPRDSEIKSYGVLVNSFYELEPAYADYYRNIMGRRAWQIGPVSLRNNNNIDKAQRGKRSTVDEHYVLNWLDSKEPNSVLYICFGSTSKMNNAQLLEIAMALEDLEFSFVWVIRKLRPTKKRVFYPNVSKRKRKERV
ncbi:hypothetical protein C5167_001510 [Papaver somniferum]|uniref:UDP-glycosyltransferases domain-containing protein n=1 Tax=Papaver somniferum TaxID=3469 RepID=A0A4Y7KYU3_PAPSO|nr:hypothetical protein C5167_001510 [Papaver somniferum]